MGRLALSAAKPNRHRHVSLGFVAARHQGAPPTTINYAAAEGTNVFDSGPVQVRNAQIVANESGSEGNFVAALLNGAPPDPSYGSSPCNMRQGPLQGCPVAILNCRG